MTRKIIAGITIALALSVTAATAIIAAGYWNTSSQSDRCLILIPPIAVPFLAACIGLLALGLRTEGAKTHGSMIGACLGCILYLIFPGLQILLQYDMVTHDGTGFWGVIMLPSIYFGIPFPIIGALIGLLIGFVIDWRRGKRNVQPAGGAYFLPGAGKKSAHP